MNGFPASLGGGGADTSGRYDEFDPATQPEPGSFLQDHDVLAGRDHLAVHRLARELFEDRGVYDMTFGYNLARLNLDGRHPDAGYRYAVEDPTADDALDPGPEDVLAEDPLVLRAEFTPTTPFCPQSDTLTKGSFRAWNGLLDRHEYDLVRVRVDEMHQRAAAINAALADLEATFCETTDRGDDTGSLTGYDAPF